MKFCKKLTVIQLVKKSNVVGFKCYADDELISDIKNISLGDSGYCARATLTFYDESQLEIQSEYFEFDRESIE
jgi:hypothetical protein